MRKPQLSTFVLGGVGAALMIGAATLDGSIDSRDLRVLGAVIVLYALARGCVARVARPTSAAYELGRADGYREGYEDGRKVGRPVVVKLPVACRKDAAHSGCGAAAARNGSAGTTPADLAPVESPAWRLTGADSAN